VSLDSRLEYLTLAVGNAKSHPVAAGGRHETAIAFLTDLEEKLDVAKVQLEIYNALLPHINDPGEDGNKIRHLGKRLLTMSQVRLDQSLFSSPDPCTQLYQLYAESFDLPVMKLLILHVSEHRDDQLVRSIWDRIFEDGMHDTVFKCAHLILWCPALEKDADCQTNADHIIASIVPLGKRFYPSEYAFPLRESSCAGVCICSDPCVGHIASLLERFSLKHWAQLPKGWVPRLLIQCGVPHSDVWDVLHEMYESHVSSFFNSPRIIPPTDFGNRFHRSMNRQAFKPYHQILRFF